MAAGGPVAMGAVTGPSVELRWKSISSWACADEGRSDPKVQETRAERRHGWGNVGPEFRAGTGAGAGAWAF